LLDSQLQSQRRQLILEAMLVVVGERGYRETTVAAVAARAGVGRSDFYAEFACEEDCYLRAYEEAVARAEAEIGAAAAAATSWEQRLRAGLGRLLEILDAEPARARALVVEVHLAGPRALRRRGEALARASAYLERARAETGGAPGVGSEATAAGILSVVHGRLAAGRCDLRELLGEFMFVAVLPHLGTAAAAAQLAAQT
jgi:AcrR family transcriptional regulator